MLIPHLSLPKNLKSRIPPRNHISPFRITSIHIIKKIVAFANIVLTNSMG
jgi:hypothetical protein